MPASAISASITGPMLPSGVLSKVEQYFRTTCAAPCPTSQRYAASDCSTASRTGAERLFKATIPQSTSGAAGPSGMPG